MSVKKGKLRHIHIEPDTAKGSKGAQVTISKHITEGANKGAWLRSDDEEKKSHKTPEEVAKHVLQTLKEHFADGDENVDGAKASKGGKTSSSKDDGPTSDDGPQAANDSWD